VIAKRIAYAAAVLEAPRDKLVFVDEAGVNLAMTMTFARATRGQRAFARAPFARGTNISLMAAIREDAVVAWRPRDGAIDTDRFLAFVKDDLAPKLEKGDIVVMDNVRFHKADVIREAIEAVGARLLFTPPYSPEMNAIEEVFSLVKGQLRKIGARNIPDLVDALRESIAATTRHLRKYVSHVLKFAALVL